MSFLTPLFILGLTAVALPILFHLIRRTPRGLQPFSSLMFLSPSPPRLTRRSRLDNLLLLLLRGLAVCLLALAFARPFLREAVNLALDNTRGRRIAIVLDTSASMRRGNVWPQAIARLQGFLDRLEASDDVALFTFAEGVQTVVDFETDPQQQPLEKIERIRRQLPELAPGWGRTNLGLALLTAADALGIANDLQQSDAALQIMLFSDLQRGALIDSLQAYQWPLDVAVSLQRLAPASSNNATLRVLTSEEATASDEELRVRITNVGDSETDQFFLAWPAGSAGSSSQHLEPLAVYVPPGQSRVVRVPRGEDILDADRLLLSGDDFPFDNVFYAVPLEKEELLVGYVGEDSADDPDGLRYYLELALSDTVSRTIEILSLAPRSPLGLHDEPLPDLIVVTQTLDSGALEELRQYVEGGGSLLSVINGPESAVQLARFDGQVRMQEEEVAVAQDYVMLGEIDFSHPLFAVFAKPQYSDFTKIHFWNHVRLAVPNDDSIRVIARFDDDSPALWEKAFGKGRLWVMTSGWSPSDSQLALSTKFVPLVTGILDQASGRSELQHDYRVHQAVPRPSGSQGDLSVRKPDGSLVLLPAEETEFRATDQPGVYRFEWGERTSNFAVNLASIESDTAPLNEQRLEQLGVQLGLQASRTEEMDRQRQLRDIELESQQKLWRWLIVAALGVLCWETWLAGRKAHAAERRT